MLILLAAALADAPPSVPARMAALYDEACLQTFPIHAQVDALMAKKGATPLTAEQVKVMLRDDPGRGWRLKNGDTDMFVFLELPPFHACSVRAGIDGGPVNLTAYRRVTDAYKMGHPGWTAEKPMNADMGPIHIRAEHEARSLPGGGSESLMVIDQHITDPARRAKGETGTMLRFVRQIRMEK